VYLKLPLTPQLQPQESKWKQFVQHRQHLHQLHPRHRRCPHLHRHHRSQLLHQQMSKLFHPIKGSKRRTKTTQTRYSTTSKFAQRGTKKIDEVGQRIGRDNNGSQDRNPTHRETRQQNSKNGDTSQNQRRRPWVLQTEPRTLLEKRFQFDSQRRKLHRPPWGCLEPKFKSRRECQQLARRPRLLQTEPRSLLEKRILFDCQSRKLHQRENRTTPFWNWTNARKSCRLEKRFQFDSRRRKLHRPPWGCLKPKFKSWRECQQLACRPRLLQTEPRSLLEKRFQFDSRSRKLHRPPRGCLELKFRTRRGCRQLTRRTENNWELIHNCRPWLGTRKRSSLTKEDTDQCKTKLDSKKRESNHAVLKLNKCKNELQTTKNALAQHQRETTAAKDPHAWTTRSAKHRRISSCASTTEMRPNWNLRVWKCP